LFVGIGLGGVASAVITPATDLAVIQQVPERRLAIAFGIKQSSLPAASLLAGIGVPVLALTVGWRWTFVAVMLLALPTLALVRTSWNTGPERPTDSPDPGGRGTDALRQLRPLVVGMGLAMAAVSSTGAFYVQSALDKGIGAGGAGLLLAAGSALGIFGRFVFTWRLSATSDPFGIVAVLTTVGAVGILGIAAAPSVGTLLLATLVAFGAGWGWNGLFTHAVVASHRQVAARASGMLVAASATGGVLGPSSFGLLATATDLSVAWVVAAAEMLLASVLWVVFTRSRTSVEKPSVTALRQDC
jgi:cyanate permease